MNPRKLINVEDGSARTIHYISKMISVMTNDDSNKLYIEFPRGSTFSTSGMNIFINVSTGPPMSKIFVITGNNVVESHDLSTLYEIFLHHSRLLYRLTLGDPIGLWGLKLSCLQRGSSKWIEILKGNNLPLLHCDCDLMIKYV